MRKTSITAPAGQRSRRDGESRISASTRPSGTPKASAAPVTFSVLRRPSASRSAFAQTGAKFQTCIGGAGALGARAGYDLPSISFITGGEALGSRPKPTRNSSYHFCVWPLA